MWNLLNEADKIPKARILHGILLNLFMGMTVKDVVLIVPLLFLPLTNIFYNNKAKSSNKYYFLENDVFVYPSGSKIKCSINSF